MSNPNIWISKDGYKMIDWSKVAAVEFFENTESPVSQRDYGKIAYPDKPTLRAGGASVYRQDALDAFESFKGFMLSAEGK